ncbi:hypothetical protein PG990_004681 [Apiospora arundinis]
MWLAPVHPEVAEDLALILPLHQLALGNLDIAPAAEHVLVQAALVEAHALLLGQQPHAPVEDVVAREVDEGGAELGLGDKEQVDASPDRTPVLVLVVILILLNIRVAGISGGRATIVVITGVFVLRQYATTVPLAALGVVGVAFVVRRERHG